MPSKNKLPHEKILQPFYAHDFHFMGPGEVIPPLTDQVQETEIFTTLNFSTTDLSALARLHPIQLSFRIPVWGLEDQWDYFFEKGSFNVAMEKLNELLLTFPDSKITLAYQLNCLSRDEFSSFQDFYQELQQKHPLIGLKLEPTLLPPYLHHELKADGDEQMLATLYFGAVMKRPGFSLTKIFPHSLALIKKSAEAFLRISPASFQIQFERKEFDSSNSNLSQEKVSEIRSLLGQEADIFLQRFFEIKQHIPCAHSDLEMLEVLISILKLSPDTPGVILEAGVFKGGSTTRLSLACALKGRELLAYDSFQGLPPHQESSPHMLYPQGAYFGNLTEVQNNLTQFGEAKGVKLIPGWFKDTLPELTKPVALAFLDVDLASSNREVLMHLWPRLLKGAVVYGHDAHFKEVQELLNDQLFWEKLGGRPTLMERIPGSGNLLRLIK